ncbi:MAG: type IV secretion system DNA-binding domain-containing protein [Patescibacteria group bacterium]
MSLFQFGLQTNTEPVRAVTQGDLYISGIILWFMAGLALLIGLLFLLRIILRRRASAKQATFNRVTLLVTLPKFRHEEESSRTGTKEQIKEAISAAEVFFSAVGGLKAQHGFRAWLFGRQDEVAFEIVSHNKLIRFYISVPRAMRQMIEQQLSAAYSDVYIEEVEDYNIFQPTGVIVGSYLVFRRQDVFPIKTYTSLEKDPLNGLTNILSKLPEGDGAAFQFLVRSSPSKWRKQGIRVASNMQQGMKLDDAIKGKKKKKTDYLELAGFGGDKPKEPEKDYRLSPLEDQMVKGLQEKASKAGMDVCIRLVSASKTAEAAQSLMQNMLNAFAQFNIYEYGNSFVKVVPRRKKRIIRNFIYRTFDERNTIVMNAEEMASVWHLPLPWTETPNIQWLLARKGSVPANIPGPEDGDIELGYNMFRGVKTPVWMKSLDRTRHMYIIGKSGSGKSQLIANLALQDIRAGHGVAVVEPHGDLIELILGNIPKERVDDVIVFNPSDVDRPMGLNMLEAKDESMKDFAAQEMVAIFYKLFPPEMIGPMFEHHMRNVMLTLMADNENPGTIAEIPRMFSDNDFQQIWRAKVKDPVIQSYWINEVDKTSDFHKSEMLGYLISKVGRFVENEMMRNIIGQTRSSFDFREVMDKKKILLVNLSKGKTGDVNAELLGLIIVSKLQMAALTRADIPEEQRHDFYLYIDEFQNFITDSIATILSEARKYRLNLIIAHQYIGQLVKNNDTKIRDAVFGNVGTNFVARIGPEDVETLEKLYEPEFSGYDMINSDKFTWYVKMIVDNAQIKPFTLNFTPPPKGDVELATAIKELSRLKYGRDRAIVTADLTERMQMVNLGPIVSKPGEF